MNAKSARNQHHDVDTNSNSQVDILNESFSNSITSSNIRKGASLYIICEKSQLKSLKSSDLNKGDNSYISFIPVDVHDVKDTKNSFKKLCKACVPSAAQFETEFTTTQSYSNVNQNSFANRGQNYTSFNNKASKSSSNNFRRSSHKKFNRLNNGINQFNTNINYNHSLTNSSHGNQGPQLSSSALGFHKLLNDSKWFEQLQVSLFLRPLTF